jgi:tetratricopeptide (TPR) repeat protein
MFRRCARLEAVGFRLKVRRLEMGGCALKAAPFPTLSRIAGEGRVGVLLLCAVTLAACSSISQREELKTQEITQKSAPTAGLAGPPPIPPEAMQRFERALTLLSAGDLGPAAGEFQRLAEAYPDYSGPLVNLGIVYLKSGKFADAEKVLQAATQRGEPNPAAFNQLGIAYRQQGRFKEADEAYSRALSIDPNYALAHLNLGVLCDMYLDDPQRALNAYESYLRLAPNADARVAGWVKELRNRLGVAEPRAPESTSPAPTEASGSEPAAQTSSPMVNPLALNQVEVL